MFSFMIIMFCVQCSLLDEDTPVTRVNICSFISFYVKGGPGAVVETLHLWPASLQYSNFFFLQG
jgi:hypothetical protein